MFELKKVGSAKDATASNVNSRFSGLAYVYYQTKTIA